MKRIKKLASVLLALVMMFAMSATAFAADPANGETYTAYKIFDATISGDNAAYSIASDSQWLTVVQGYAETGLTLTRSADGTKYVVTTSKDFSAESFAAYLAKNIGNNSSDATGVASNGSVTLNLEKDGYYLITSSLGSICQLVTGGSITIVEKNTVPSITKKVWEDSTSNWKDDKATIDVIDTVKYQLIVNTGSNSKSSSTGVNDDYVITDVLPEGFAYDGTNGAVAVAVGNDVWTADTDYITNYNEANRTLTITLKADKVATLDQNANITIEYSATVTAANAAIAKDGNTNTATLTYSQQRATDTATVYTYEIGGEKYFQKVDGSDSTALKGVTFQLSKTDDGTTTYANVDDKGYLTGWSDKATDLVTNDAGTINVKGLDAGTYTLTETKALPGYNLLTDTITVVISEEGAVTYKLTNGSQEASSSIQVENNTGSELPTTGGMGTTLIYALGVILVLGAGVTLVVRRRMSADK